MIDEFIHHQIRVMLMFKKIVSGGQRCKKGKKMMDTVVLDKHAYLIMAHNEFSILLKLLALIDDGRNDIYLHIDKKAKEVPKEILSGNCVKKAGLHIIKSGSVNWAGYSQIECEVRLLDEAVGANTNYSYYHFISGCDLPLHNQDYIHSFFYQNYGKEFIGSNDEWANRPQIRDRYQVYHFFQDLCGKKHGFFWLIDRVLGRIQRPFVSRCNGLNMSGGPNWFSITQPFAEYILKNKKWIKHTFRFTVSGDEHVIQTILKTSPFAQSQYRPDASEYSQCMRYVDFGHADGFQGSPKSLDYIDAVKLLGNTSYIFARKFSTANESHRKAVEFVYQSLINKDISL